MCGIFGYIGGKNATPLVLEGLARLEYRGYDSAGLAVADGDGLLQVRRAAGKLQNLAELVQAQPFSGATGVGHTRWATHGAPTEANAHPHTDSTGTIAVVHNGIVENYQERKAHLVANGHTFSSTTDSEVIPHLVEEHLAKGHAFVEAVRLAANELHGSHAIVFLSAAEPKTLVAVRVGHAGGIAVGYGDGEMFVASDLPALVPLTSTIAFLASGELAVLAPTGCFYMTLQGDRIDRRPKLTKLTHEAAAKGGHDHFMLKEIMEQPEATMSGLRGRLSFSPDSLTLDDVPFSPAELRGLQRVVLVGMGTSYHAAQYGARLIEELARIPSVAENAAEFRYRQPVLDRHTLVVAVGQSGETADTLEAMHLAKVSGARTVTISNVSGSQATQLAEGTILMHAGLEVGVAASKTFTSALLCLYLLATHLGVERGTLSNEAMAKHLTTLAHAPALLARTLELNQSTYGSLSERYSRFRRFLFIGRGAMESVAMEGALKLKELSYIHAEGMTAAELKHGPIALVDSETPVVALVPHDALYSKMVSNIQEVRARNGLVLAVATEGDEALARLADDVLWVPSCPAAMTPLVVAIPLQLFAYHVALQCGTDIDQPRNLAKSVTVE